MSALSKFLVAVNLTGAAISLFFFAATFFAKGVLVSKAREFAFSQTRHHLQPVADEAERVLTNPILSKALPRKAKLAIERELADYRMDPDKWLLKMANDAGGHSSEFDLAEIKNPVARKGFEMISRKFSDAREKFRLTFDHLLADLRIFWGTNFCALLLAAAFAKRLGNDESRKVMCIYSVALLAGTAFSSLAYFGNKVEWLWRILADRYIGWSYTGILIAVSAYLTIHLLDLSRRESGPKIR